MSLVVLSAWGLGLGDRTALVSGLPPMTANTAVMVLMAGTSLLLRTSPGPTGPLATGLGILTALLAAAVLATHATGYPLVPFRILSGPQTAGSLFLLGAALTIFDRRTVRGSRPAGWLAAGGGAIAILGALGHLFGNVMLHGIPGAHSLTGTSLPTIAALIALSLGILLAKPDQGFMATVTSGDVGGWAARRILLGLLAVAPVVALLALGARDGRWFDLSFATASIVFLGFAWSAVSIIVAGARLNRLADARRRSEERARELQDQASDGIFVADLDGRYTEVNAAGCRMLGYTREELLARTVLDLIPAEDTDRLAHEREALLRGGVQVSEWNLRRRDGTFIPCEVSAKILPDGRWQGLVRDISERRRAEAALRLLRERERFRLALEAAAGAVVVVGRDGRIAFVNGQAERLFRWSGEELTGRPIEDLLPERFRSGHEGHREGYFSSRVSRRPMGQGRDLFALRRDGVEFPVEISLTPVEEAGQQFVVASVTDITERKRGEEALRESEARLRLFFEHAPVSLAMFDRDMRYLAVTRRWAEEYLRGAEDAVGHLHYEIFPECPERWRAAYRRGLAGEIVRVEEDVWTRADGRTSWARHEVLPWYAAEGGIGGIVIFTEDITERKRSDDALLKSVEELEGFAYTVSHDLRAPLRSIEGYSHILKERLGDAADPESRGMLERMAQSAVKLDRLIQDLLAYTAIGRETADPEPVDLDSMVDTVAGRDPKLRRARLRVRKPLGRVSARPSLLLQALTHLLDNAFRYVPEGRTPEIDVWTESRPDRRRVLTVQDNGAGIPLESREAIFKPFIRLHEGLGDGRTGIGLAIVRRAVERMGGTVSLDSEPGRGSRFHVELGEA